MLHFPLAHCGPRFSRGLSHTEYLPLLTALPCFFISTFLVVQSSARDCSWFADVSGGQNLANCTVVVGPALSAFTDRDPGLWVQFKPVNSTGQLYISDVTLLLTSCFSLWFLAELECTFTPSSTWPVAGLQAGPGFLFYPHLVGPTATATRLNVTCPPNDWAALLSSNANTTTSQSAAGLAPCGTATVSSGTELISALEQLQPGHARLLISLRANVSLPADPTKQRAGPAPGDDDQVPLVTIYRNVTLAGRVHGAPTELDVRRRRNAFGLQAGWQQLQQQQQGAEAPAQQAVATFDGSNGGVVWRCRPVIVLADLMVAGPPPGAPGSWPLGLFGSFHFYAGMDRGGSAGLQLIGLRSRQIYPSLDVGYMNYWYNRMISFLGSERESAAWMLRFMDPVQTIADPMGGRTVWGHAGDYVLGFNSSASPVPLLTPPLHADFDLYSSAPAGTMIGTTVADGGGSGGSGGGGSAANFTYTYALPPGSFAVAGNATTLLALLQEAWTGGPRVILLLRNITLQRGAWPEGGAALSYNATLAGPAAGDPVTLDTSGLQLAHPAAPSSAAALDGGGGPAAAPVVVLLQRLTVAGLGPPLLVANPGDVAAVGTALDATADLRDWRDRCLYSAPVGGAKSNSSSDGGSGAAAVASTAVQYEARNSTLVLAEGSLRLLRYLRDPSLCPSNVAADSSAFSAACAGLQSMLPARLATLLRQTLLVEGQASFDPSLAVNFTFATLGALTLADSRAVPAAPSANASVTTGSRGPTACDATELLLALVPLMASMPSRGPVSTSSPMPPSPLPLLASPPAATAVTGPGSSTSGGGVSRRKAVAGGAAAGTAVAALCCAAAATALYLRRRRWRGQPLPPTAAKEADTGSSLASEAGVTVVIIGGGPCDGPPSSEGRSSPPPREAVTVTMMTSAAVTASKPDAALSSADDEDNGFSCSCLQAGALRGAAGPAAGGRVHLGGPGSRKPSGTTAAAPTAADHGGGGGAAGSVAARGGDDGGGGLGGAVGCSALGSELSRPAALRQLSLKAMPSALRRLPDGASPPPSQARPRSVRSTEVAGTEAANSSGGASPAPSSGARGTLRTALADEIDTMMRRLQTQPKPKSQQRAKLLGRGAHGVVNLGEWRGMPAAIKEVILYADASLKRRHQLVAEVALTMTIDHPHIVPTYNFSVSTLRAEAGVSLGSLLASGRDLGEFEAEDEADAVALRLRLVMQYCDGGTLRSALQSGRFSAPPPPSSSSLQAVGRSSRFYAPPLSPLLAAERSGVDRSGGLGGCCLQPHAGDAAARSLTGTGAAGSCAASASSAGTQNCPVSEDIAAGSAQSRGRRSPTPGQSSAASARLPSFNAARFGRPLGWADAAAAPNLVMALFAAVDIIRGIEYLHARGVVHGDLTENNVLLKTTSFTLPPAPAPPPPPGSQSQQRTQQRQQQQSPFQRQQRWQWPQAQTQEHALGTRSTSLGDDGVDGSASDKTEITLAQDGPAADGSLGEAHQSAGVSTAAAPPLQAPARTEAAVAVAMASQHAWAASALLLPGRHSLLAPKDMACMSAAAQGPGGGEAGDSLRTLRGPACEQAGLPADSFGLLRPPLGPMEGQPQLQQQYQQRWQPQEHEVKDDERSAVEAEWASQMLGFVYKIADFGLSVELQGGSEMHTSDSPQGTPFFAAPEVVQEGRLSPAADIYSFGVLLWLLMHGVSLAQLRRLLPRIAYVAIAPLLLRNASAALPPAAHSLLARCLAMEPEQRPRAAALRQMLEELLRDVAGPELSHLLLSSARKEQVTISVSQL